MPEKLGFDQFVRDSSTVYRDKRHRGTPGEDFPPIYADVMLMIRESA